MPKKGKRSQAAKTRWRTLSSPDCPNPNENNNNVLGCASNSEEECVSVLATHSQNSNRYRNLSRNRQCTCNSLVFLENLTTAHLNNILDKGDVMYCEARQRFPNSVHLATDELPDQVIAHMRVYNVDSTHLSMYGTFQDPVPEAADNYLDLEAGLSCLLSDVRYALLVMSGLCIAVFRTTSGKYGYFDPHSRTKWFAFTCGFTFSWHCCNVDFHKSKCYD